MISEQIGRGGVDEIGQLVDLVVEQVVTGVQVELALDRGNSGQVAEDDPGHGE